MLQDIVHPPQEQLSIEELSSPIATLMLDYSDQDLYQETLRSSDVSSCSGGGYCFDNNSYPDNSFSCFSSFPNDITRLDTTILNNNTNVSDNNNNNSSSSSSSNNNYYNNNNNNFSIFLDFEQDTDPDLSATLSSILSSPSGAATFSLPAYTLSNSNHQDQMDLLALQSQLLLPEGVNTAGFSTYSPDSVVGLAPQMSLPSVLDEDCLCPLPPYICFDLDPSSPSSVPFLDQTGMGGSFINGGVAVDASGMFTTGIVLEQGLQPQELDFPADNAGVYTCHDHSVYSSGELQALNESQQQQQQVATAAPLTSDISTFEESTFKVGRLSVEERKEKIHRYLKKRNERNFTKKIKYACRKTLADSRPRVRGRFAKNDEFGDVARPSGSNHEDEDDEENFNCTNRSTFMPNCKVGLKEEEEMIGSADIFAHISGANSFKFNYPIQSWM